MSDQTLLTRLIHRWRGDSGYREVLVLAIPLILSTSAWTVQHFIDRMFLTWYSPETIAAAMPAGMLNFTLMSFFIGTVGYVSTFVAQYYGSKQHHRVGAAIWQSLYLSIISGAAFFALIPLSEPLFGYIGHDEVVRQYEVIYFRILCYGGIPGIATSALSGFFSGLGRTWPVMWVNVLATVVNLTLDYAMIFGRWGFPEMGIQGAAIATVIAQYVALLAYILWIFKRTHDQEFHVRRAWRFDRALCGRLLRFGAPSGFQFIIDMMGITIFVLLMGRLGTINLAATNIAFNINSLAFMPMLGFAIAVSVLVGQHLGNNRPDLAERGVYSGFHITLVYMCSVAAFYVLAPQLILMPYAAQADPVVFAEIKQLVVVLLRFVAVYSVFDSCNLIFASAIKGAGDTRFVMLAITVMSVGGLIVPSYVAIVVLNANVFIGWTIATAYISVLGIVFLLRYLGGKWKSMRVIEDLPPTPPFTPPMMPENPISEYEL
jgi:multidrug resistance protein, MATE family